MTTGTTNRAAAPLCWSAVALEGFDLVVIGVVLPVLLRDPAWGLTPATATLISVVGLLGVMVGALAIGPITDTIGRRKTMIATVTGFSVLTLACAFAPDPVTFGVLRVLAGLGLGGVLPVALALVNEHARGGPRRQRHHRADDRLPRRRGGDRAARDRGHRGGGAGRRCS